MVFFSIHEVNGCKFYLRMKDGLFNDSLVTWKWKACHRSWQREAEAWACSRAVVLIDPLITVRKRSDAAKKTEIKQSELPKFVDPLGLFFLN